MRHSLNPIPRSLAAPKAPIPIKAWLRLKAFPETIIESTTILSAKGDAITNALDATIRAHDL